ncbi:MAG TPA: acyl-ACP--UDP-N-acetylglucosamine O-acyltransferase [Candidatus Limnocylindrales bacterium]|jgi:UDP-N-acetylglucosamine acyltransferase|nr:acyl-ACP--UDP-N-acetylglucosamine O-acyltransferase [Candidatus Limnocylindrales bacterium]
MSRVHPTAIVDARAEIDGDVQIGPYCVIGAGVRIGKGCRVHSHAVITGRTTLGEGNVVFPFATIGDTPQDLKYKGEPSELLIGNRNTIREYVSLNPGTTGGGMVTRVGDQNLLMMQCHIAHDCLLGDRNVVANGATLGGHVVIEDFVIVGGLVGIHQFVRIGTGAILGAGSMVSKDVPPYCNATGDRAKLHGLNLEGLKRRGFDKTVIALLRKAYRIVFQSALRTEDALKKIREELPAIPEIEKFASFIAQSGRGVCR